MFYANGEIRLLENPPHMSNSAYCDFHINSKFKENDAGWNWDGCFKEYLKVHFRDWLYLL